MKTKPVTLLVAVLGFTAPPALLAQCCGSGATMKEGCTMPGMSATADAGHGPTAASNAAAPVKPVFAEPVQSVFDNYIKVQASLAQDSIQGLSGAGTAMAKAIEADSQHALPAKVARQAQALGQSKDLDAARAAFKSLSDTLIDFVKTQQAATGTYHIAYCPMAKASWLQTGTTVMNPYFGKAMTHCGQLKS
jgi:hypothetical protein